MDTTTEALATKFGTDLATARGVLEFLVATGLASKGKAAKVPGTRGRAKALYTLSPEAMEVLGQVEASKHASNGAFCHTPEPQEQATV